MNTNAMQKAVKSAIKGVNKGDGGPFGAAIVKDGETISVAHNEVVKTNDPTMHAEINAIRKASKKLKTFDLSGCKLYTTCMPCPMCLAAIKWANIRKVYYGTTSQDAHAIGFRDDIFYGELNMEKIEGIELVQLERQSCLKPFALWQSKADKIRY